MKSRTKLWMVMLASAVFSLILIILLTAAVGRLWVNGYNLHALDNLSHTTIDQISRQSNVGSSADIKPILDSVHKQNPALRLEWVSADGSVIYDTSGEAKRYNFGQIAARFDNMPDQLWSTNKPITLEYSLNRNGKPYYLLLALNSNAMKAGQIYLYTRTLKTLLTIVLPVLLSAFVPYLFAWWYFSSINRRLRKLNRALNQVSLQGEPPVLYDKSKDEIGQLTRHYNAMAERITHQADEIHQFETRRRLFISNLSHDLRTPLTLILGHAEAIRTGVYKTENELRTNAKVILQRSRYMNHLLNQLLDISRQDSDVLEPNFAFHNVSELLRNIMAEYLTFLDNREFTVKAEIPPNDIEAKLDATLIERAVRNLIDNAIRYGSDGAYLEVGLAETEGHVRIWVTDRGKGVSSDAHDQVFERFYRGGARKGDGLGIGLSIVKEIVEAHHGTIQLTSTPYVQTTFLIELPQR